MVINAQPQGLMSMAGGQAQTDAVNDANGVRTESPHVPPVTKGDMAVFVTNHVSLPQPRSTPQSKASAKHKGNDNC